MKEIYAIFVADSNVALLEGLVSIINQEPTFEVVGTASTKTGLMITLPASLPDLILLDIDMADFVGMRLHENHIRLVEVSKIILMTEHCQHSLIKRIKAAGVLGCLKKSCDAAELVYAMNMVLEGKPYFSGFQQKIAENRKHENTFSEMLTSKETSIVNSSRNQPEYETKQQFHRVDFKQYGFSLEIE